MLVAAGCPVIKTHVGHPLLLHFLQPFQGFFIFRVDPLVHHGGELVGLGAEFLVFFQAMGLGAKHHTLLRVIKKNVRDIGMCGEQSFQGVSAGLAGGGKSRADVVNQFICPVINLLFGNCQYLAELTLNGGLESVFTLDLFQMESAQDHQSRGGQYHGEFQRQDQPSSLVPAAFWLHGVSLIGPFLGHPATRQ